MDNERGGKYKSEAGCTSSMHSLQTTSPGIHMKRPWVAYQTAKTPYAKGPGPKRYTLFKDPMSSCDGHPKVVVIHARPQETAPFFYVLPYPPSQTNTNSSTEYLTSTPPKFGKRDRLWISANESAPTTTCQESLTTKSSDIWLNSHYSMSDSS
ncbi:hypothetical protein TESG_08355 [Trichophyton tonsurans CBS 112818]|uniref:Uncharacterized protein n=1 Tax=Trichophyton tonsurans (strain CBS 112818) TaxID=647933 RepID=F2RU99_TRIT1|nr:hypothetical protein TESG_08355 [Trichophyton tonsurans CBS 112818]